MNLGRALPVLATLMTLLSASEAYAQIESLNRVANGRSRAENRRRSWVGWTSGNQAAARLRSSSSTTRREAAEDLGRHGDATHARSSLVDALESESDAAVRIAIVRALSRRGFGDSTPALIEAFRAGPAAIEVALALGEVGSGEAIRALAEGLAQTALGDAASAGLIRVGDRAVPIVLATLRSELSVRGVRVLGEIGRRDATHALIGYAEHESEPIRVAAIESLATIADPRAASALAARLGDPSTVVQAAALEALARAGGEAQVDAVLEFLKPRAEPDAANPSSDLAIVQSALTTLVRISETRGAAAIEEMITADDPERVRVAADVALAHPSSALVPVLYGLLQEGSRAQEAATALVEVADGAGVPVLLREARVDEPNPVIISELAAALRRHRTALPRRVRSRALTVLRNVASKRGLLLRALAGDDSATSSLARLLESDEAADRALGAHGLAMLGTTGGVDLTALGDRETDDEAFRRIAHAALALGVPAPFPGIFRRFAHNETRPDALVWAASSLEGARARVRRRVLEQARRDLRGTARQAASAAWALAEADDASSWRALVVAFEHEDNRRSLEVRKAIARALLMLRVPEARSTLAGIARIERDGVLRQTLEDAANAELRPTASFASRGRYTLRVWVKTSEPEARIPLDVLLPDGRWLQIHSAEGGELVLTGLPDGTADVRVRLAD